ncbi:DUF1593 domain-containing protein [Aliifodinibius sp. S!AR15-10]|uniref:DUF1593 domain-containing protein n=1 Tax=Aliifodinibius sp. S!AR15-10 TaxID=2950437 RepID=UPI00285CE3E9|nr:nucleoside hydrolase-like domain-containing protein [Aliifodinibius sp. S!AR15-10]MDR8393355.1 DUF1593 domain-containing protein [Aliifodinibius sp. S!AR15-10]
MKSYLIRTILLILLLPFTLSATSPADSLKPRIIVLTDISPNDVEPDDMESMIRLFVHADLFEIEGLVATTGWSSSGGNADWVRLIHDAIDGYEQDLPNLRKRSGQEEFNKDETEQKIGYWPSPDYLRSRTVVGSQVRGMKHISEGNNSPGSNLIIEMADQGDSRPLWVLVWGGGNTLAQAIWQVQQERTVRQLEAFLGKIRTYTITDQDRSYKDGTPYDISSHQWMRREFKKDLFFIWDECAWRFQNGTGRENWDQYATHIQGHGTFGKIYPKYKYGVEGDTPSFLYVLPNGLNNSEHPSWGGWGGYFEWAMGPDEETYAYTNHSDMQAHSVCREQLEHFYPATFNNFVARMDWAAEGTGNRNPIVVVNGDPGLSNIKLTPKPGTSVTLDASGTTDPDGDNLTYSWWIMSAAETYQQEVTLAGANSEQATVQVPVNAAGKSFHVILEVTDNGSPNLTSYRRIIIEPAK